MKINKIQNNNPNFGMALRINSKLKSELLSASPETIKNLEKIGKDIENVKLYNVCYENSIYTPAVRSAKGGKDYFAELREQETQLGRLYTVTCGDETYQGYNPNEPPIFGSLFGKRAAEEYEKYNKLPNNREKAAMLSKLLEEKDLKYIRAIEAQKQEKLAKEIEENKRKAQQEAAVDSILSKYQYEQKVEPKPQKTNLFKRIANKFTSLLSK